ncbi:hypothetical protein L249_6505 [Ophiocordyceps polyrhachis-furcata BCC 54312]|uniref:Zn(2)-C6 fungal-type domain-containing protein n=1 Tax=Ophiocordyceps polyrhachis-furcata BCC 54312 TaxID=1330021 RepID=A0A367LLS4_9HYPO|nr:hypothetical protein L249_6505 [Ophiocordyceps polyrhachis-furcata BCC 54312]
MSDETKALTPDEANRIIRSHRKVRYGSACWPCRQRKVKCDNKQPCENCVKREHTELCSYKPNRTATAAAAAAAAKRAHPTRARSLSADIARTGTSNWPRADLDNDTDAVSDRFLGQNSIPALLRREQPSSAAASDDGVYSILGLNTAAPFPFTSPRRLDLLTRDLAAEMPSDRDIISLFRTYKEVPQPFWGFVHDMDDLESKLMAYLEDRSGDKASSQPVTAPWLAILFAVLAVGAQFDDDPFAQRTHNCQKFTEISFHFLRVSNFLLRPSFDSIQALLLLGFVLLNDMKAEASWALLGLTSRLAQSLGLHRQRPSQGASPDDGVKEAIRRELHLKCLWHDTLSSLSFDRCPIMNFPPELSVSSDANPRLSYLEIMYGVIEIISCRFKPGLSTDPSYAEILSNCAAVENLRQLALPHLKDRAMCKTVLESLQCYAIRLHTCFLISVACRPALRRDCGGLDPQQRIDVGIKCKENLIETVKMFLAMNQLSCLPTRSWAFTYHALSSALLLSFLCDASDKETRQLQADLIRALSDTAADEKGSPGPRPSKSNKDIELSGPLWRALTALKQIYDHGSGLIQESDSPAGPSAIRLAVPPSRTAQPLGHQPGDSSREDAALAMAEMQNGASLTDLSTPTECPPPWPTGNSLDGMLGMAPMDLFDNIWAVPTEPLIWWNSGERFYF